MRKQKGRCNGPEVRGKGNLEPAQGTSGKRYMEPAQAEAGLGKSQPHDLRSNQRREGEKNDEDEIEVVPDTPECPQGPKDAHQAVFPWLRRTAALDEDPVFSTEDLALKHIPELNPSTLILSLDETDQVPIHKTWGICLLGIFAWRFPGKVVVFNLIQRWPYKARVSFHRRGWMVFQFRNEEEMEETRQNGPHAVFGIPLVLKPMPSHFNPDMDPEINIPVWLRLVDLRPTLWNESTINMIASCIGVPVATDFRTLHRENIDGPRIQVIVNTAGKPRDTLAIRLHTGEHYELKIEYEFMPKLCTKCRTYGNLDTGCTGSKDHIRQPNRKKMLPHNNQTNLHAWQKTTGGNNARPPPWVPARGPEQDIGSEANGMIPNRHEKSSMMYASPNIFSLLGEDEGNTDLSKEDSIFVEGTSMDAGPSTKGGPHRRGKQQNHAGANRDAEVDAIVDKVLANGTPYVNRRTRSTSRGREAKQAVNGASEVKEVNINPARIKGGVPEASKHGAVGNVQGPEAQQDRGRKQKDKDKPRKRDKSGSTSRSRSRPPPDTWEDRLGEDAKGVSC